LCLLASCTLLLLLLLLCWLNAQPGIPIQAKPLQCSLHISNKQTACMHA
jgi:hypothetical protein